MLVRISHETKLSYSAPVAETVFEVRMAPPSDEDQTDLGYQLRIDPPAPVTSYRDGFGNRVDLFNIGTPYRELVILATSFVRTHRRPGRDRLARGAWPIEEPLPPEALEFLQASPLVDRSPDLHEFAARLRAPAPSLEGLVPRVLEAVGGRLRYEKQVTTTRTPVSEVLRLGRGVCQDFAHLFLGACRALGLPARYISGYVHHPGEVATHAWCQIWGGAAVGWIDVDPTHDAYPDDDYILTAVGRDYSDIPPNRGIWTGRAEETIAVAVKVESVERMPPEWDGWTVPAPWPHPGRVQFQRQGPGRVQFQRQGAGQVQFQRQGAGPIPFQGLGHFAYPNQPGRGRGRRQQQGQQQQQQGHQPPRARRIPDILGAVRPC